MTAIHSDDLDSPISTVDVKSTEVLFESVLNLYAKEIIAAPDAVFPSETVNLIFGALVGSLTAFSKKDLRERKPFRYALDIANTFIGSYYSFTDNLRTGHYAPYPHEQKELRMSGDNCTTIISKIYLSCETLRLKPEIVQFFDFQDIEAKKYKGEAIAPSQAIAPSHFSLIIDVGRKHRYLFDPFYYIFGPIQEQGEDYIKIGKCQDRSAIRRTFKKIFSYSARDFVQMMDRLHDPAESLDMLITGQKVHQSKMIAKTSGCASMVYYRDEMNTLSTRLYIPQKPLSDKAVYCHMALNDEGNISQISLECYLAKDSGWNSLVDGKKVCGIDFSTARVLRRRLQSLKNQEGKNFQLKNYERVAPVLLQADGKSRESLISFTDKMHQDLSEAELQKLRPLILARTLYEFERPSENYLYTPEEHDAGLLKLVKQRQEGEVEIQPVEDLLWLKGWKLINLDRNKTRRARYAHCRYAEETNEIVKDINTLNFLRKGNKKAYSRAMDKVLFTETIKGGNTDDLEKIVRDQNLDSRIGYLAMVADFIPFIMEGRDDLELKLYRQPIKEKVIHRRMKKKGLDIAGREIVVVSDMKELTVAK